MDPVNLSSQEETEQSEVSGINYSPYTSWSWGPSDTTFFNSYCILFSLHPHLSGWQVFVASQVARLRFLLPLVIILPSWARLLCMFFYCYKQARGNQEASR